MPPTKPTQNATWATDATYTGGPEAGFNTKSEPTTPRKSEGLEPNTHPKADELNWQLNLIYLWLLWMQRVCTRAMSPRKIIPATGAWTHNTGGYIASNAIGKAYLELPLDVGDRPRDITVYRRGDGVATLQIEVIKDIGWGSETILATSTETPDASDLTTRFNLAADILGTFTVNDGFVGGQFDYVRPSGSWSDDGLVAGMTFTASGFTQAGNNVTKIVDSIVNGGLRIKVTNDSGMVDDGAGTGNERILCTPPTIAVGESMSMVFTALGSAAGLKIFTTDMSSDDGSDLT